MLESTDSQSNDESRCTTSSVLPFAFAGDSPILEQLLKACLAKSPWIELREDALMLNWQHALEHRAKTNGEQPGDPNPGVLEILEKLIPKIDFSQLAELGQFYPPRSNETFLQAKLPISELRKVDEMSALVPSIEELIDVLSQFEGTNSLRQKLLVDLKFITDCKFGKYHKYEYALGSRFVVARGDLISLVNGRAKSNVNNRYFGDLKTSNHKESWALTRRLLRYMLDIFALIEGHMNRRETQTDGQNFYDHFYERVIERFMHLGTLEKSLARLVNNIPFNGHDSKQGCFFVNRKECIAARGYNLETADIVDREYSDIEYLISNLIPSISRSRYFSFELNSKKIDKLFSEITKSCYTVNKALHGLHDEFQVKSYDNHGHLGKAIEDNVDWLFSENPIFILFTSGFLSAFQHKNHAMKTTICLSPWLTSAIVAKKTLNLEPFSYLGPDSCDLGEEMAEEPELPKDDQIRTEVSARLGAEVWRNFF